MACAIGCWVRETALVENKRNIEYNRAFLDTMLTTKTTINTTIKGMEGYDSKNTFEKTRKEKEMLEQYTWLFKG